MIASGSTYISIVNQSVRMKHYIFLMTLCLVVVQAFPEELRNLDTEAIPKASREVIPTTEAAVDTSPPKKLKSQGTVKDRTKLVNDLFKTYNKGVNPDSIILKFGVFLIDFRVLESKDAIHSHVWLVQNWTDTRLKWDPNDYGGTQLLTLDSSHIWKPDMTLYNSADPVKMANCWDSNVYTHSNGDVLWELICKMTSTCHLSLKKEPYGENTCSLKFGSWTFDGHAMDLQFYEDASLDLSQLVNTSGFEIVSHVAARNERHYPCCAEPYPDLTFNLTFRRIPAEELVKRM